MMYNIGILSLFFAIPLQLTALDGRKRNFLSVTLISSGLILLSRYIVLNTAEYPEMIVLDIILVTAVAAALYLANYVLYGYSVPVRLGIITAASGLLLLLLTPFTGVLEEMLIDNFNRVAGTFTSLPLAAGEGGGFQIEGETLYLLLKDFFSRYVLALFFFFLSYSWWVSYRLFLRMGNQEKITEGAANWDFPDHAVWLLFVPLTLLLGNRLMDQSGLSLLTGIPSYAVSNLLIIMGGLYAIKGIQIIQRLFRKWNIPRQLNLPLLLLLGMLIVIPGVNLVLLVVMAGLGVSELWVNYRIFDKE